MDEETAGEVAFSLSPPPITLSPRSEVSPAPSNWTTAHEQAAQEAYEFELAEQYIYDLMRQFASAMRALSLYDCSKCIAELEKLPHVHQMSAGVLAMVGKAHYERLEYASVCLSAYHIFSSPDSSILGRTGLPSGSWHRTVSLMGHGGVFHTTVASTAECAAFLSGTRTAQHRPSIIPGLDRCGQPLFAAKRAVTGSNLFSASCTNGSNLRVRVHSQWSRVYR